MSVSFISSNPKFLLLARRLKLPVPYVRGLLDTMWDSCHERASEVIGTPEEVEACAQWPGEDGAFFTALRDCRWIDEVAPGIWGAHNYWKHCPSYVTQRLKMRRWRAEKRQLSLAGLQEVIEQSLDSPVAVKGRSSDSRETVKGQSSATPLTVAALSRDCDVTIRTYPEPEPEPKPEPEPEPEPKENPLHQEKTPRTSGARSPGAPPGDPRVRQVGDEISLAYEEAHNGLPLKEQGQMRKDVKALLRNKDPAEILEHYREYLKANGFYRDHAWGKFSRWWAEHESTQPAIPAGGDYE